MFVQGPRQLNLDPWIQLDGRLNAPNGVIQFPHGLDTNSGTQTWGTISGTSYVTRPPFHVPGVDYYVGPDSGVTLKPAAPGGTLDPALVALGGQAPGGGTTITGEIDFTGANATNAVINGWDFTGGTVGYDVEPFADNMTFKNCNFKMGTYGHQVLGGAGVGLTCINCLFDGNNVSNPNALVNPGGSNGTHTFEYCYFKNSYAEHIQDGPTPGGTMTFIAKYCLFQDCGTGFYASGFHADVVQTFQNSAADLLDFEFNFNLVLQSPNQNTDTQGLSPNTAATNTSLIHKIGASQNVFVLRGTANANGGGTSGIWMNYPIIVSTDWLAANTNITIQNNYVDPNSPTLSYSNFLYYGDYGGTGGTTNGILSQSGNINMLNGATISGHDGNG